MRPDLIFHVVSRRKWPSLNQGGFYRPETEKKDEKLTIECVKAPQLNNYLNRNFKGRKNLFILVVDVSRLANRIKEDSESGYIYVDEGINVDSILDKIRIDCNKEGQFDLDVKSDS